MRTLYLQCNAGASGDMILGALAHLLDDPEEFGRMINSAGIPGTVTDIERRETFGISGLKVHISIHGQEEGEEHHHHHHHSEHHHEHHSLSNVLGVIDGLNVSDRVKKDAKEIYNLIAKAESEMHGTTVDLVHFHEVGALDAVADIVGACMLIEKLSPDTIVASPVRVGFGQVHCAHGLLPVPAPATASILKGIPIYAGDEEGEFCTPTGAAILSHFTDRFEQMPAMAFEKVGYGLGSKQFRIANMLRAYLSDDYGELPHIKEINCNIDDMTPEDLGGIIELLLDNNALDAFIAPCIMKKGRPGFALTCLCRESEMDKLAHLILENTSTIGLRVHDCERYAMTSRFETCSTPYGDIRVKVSEGFGIRKRKPEYDDLALAAAKHNVPIGKVRDSVTFKE